jgi:CheY-like chemotaxis protein
MKPKRRIRVLVFEDDEAVRTVLWHLLNHKGYEVFTFPDPNLCPLHTHHSCECRLRRACADIIISDINMLETNGLEFIADQQQKGCRVRHFALLSGDWTHENRLRAAQLNCQIFDKPFSNDAFYQWLKECEAQINLDDTLSDWYLQAGKGDDGSSL